MPDIDSVAQWSTTPADNDNIGGTPLAEGDMYPEDVNDAFQKLMAQAKTQFDTLSGISVQPGAIMYYARTAAPGGWLKSNGAAVSRMTYAALFAEIGTTFGAGDGTTTFNLPDLRGEFIRGLDDGRGVDVARALGSAQAGQVGPHTHTGTAANGGAHTHTGTAASAGSHTHTGTAASAGGHSHSVPLSSGSGSTANGAMFSAVVTPGLTATTGTDGAHTHSLTIDSGGSHSHSVAIDSGGAHTHTLAIDSAGGTEPRPRNIALLACIKY